VGDHPGLPGTLLATKPQIGEWKQLSEEELMEAMGGGEYKGRRAFVGQLGTVSSSFPQLPRSMTLVIRWSAGQLERLKREQTELDRMLGEVGQDLLPVQTLKQPAGIGTITASGMIAEIIDIRRFPSEDHLASYSGLGQVQQNTGERESMRAPWMYNRLSQYLFMTAALNVVRFDPNSHLAGYHRNLMKKGMEPTEATKRVARALVRVIYRKLMALIEAAATAVEGETEKEAQSGVASGQGRGDKQHLSNTPPRPRKVSRARAGGRVKKTRRATSSGTVTKATRVLSEKECLTSLKESPGR
jgi:hypothetical protein